MMRSLGEMGRRVSPLGGYFRDVPSEGVTPPTVRTANVLLPGLYAWGTTVAQPALGIGVGWQTRGSAAIAGICLVGGAAAVRYSPRLGRAVGVFGFVGASVVTWALLGSRLSPEELEPTSAALGALGWVLFAFGWGAVRAVGTVPEDDPSVVPGPPLRARAMAPRGAALVSFLSLAAAASPLGFAWRVHGGEHALMAHAAALLSAMALVGAGAHVAVERGRERPRVPSAFRIRSAASSLVLLGVLVALGAAFVLTR